MMGQGCIGCVSIILCLVVILTTSLTAFTDKIILECPNPPSYYSHLFRAPYWFRIALYATKLIFDMVMMCCCCCENSPRCSMRFMITFSVLKGLMCLIDASADVWMYYDTYADTNGRHIPECDKFFYGTSSVSLLAQVISFGLAIKSACLYREDCSSKKRKLSWA